MPNATRKTTTGSTGETSSKPRRTVYPNGEIPHRWAHALDDFDLRGSSLSTYTAGRYRWLVSYRTPVAVRIEQPSKNVPLAFLITSESYSASTGRHVRDAHWSIPHDLKGRDNPATRAAFYVPCLSGGREGKPFTRFESHLKAKLDAAAHAANVDYLAAKVEEAADGFKAYPRNVAHALNVLDGTPGTLSREERRTIAADTLLAELGHRADILARYCHVFNLTGKRYQRDFTALREAALAKALTLLDKAEEKRARNRRRVAEEKAAADEYATKIRQLLYGRLPDLRRGAADLVRDRLAGQAHASNAALEEWRAGGPSIGLDASRDGYDAMCRDILLRVEAAVEKIAGDKSDVWLDPNSSIKAGLCHYASPAYPFQGDNANALARIASHSYAAIKPALLRLLDLAPEQVCKPGVDVPEDAFLTCLSHYGTRVDNWDYIRIKDGRIETNRGATLELPLARSAWAILRPVAAAACQPDRAEAVAALFPCLIGRHVGPFTVSAASAEGITIGCHRFQWIEVFRTGEALETLPA